MAESAVAVDLDTEYDFGRGTDAIVLAGVGFGAVGRKSLGWLLGIWT